MTRMGDSGECARIVTLNTWKCEGNYRVRLDLMARGLAELDADVICLQECFAAPDLQADTATFLANELGMQACTAPARRKLRTLAGREAASTSGLAILTRDPVQRTTMRPLPMRDADGERLLLMADMQLCGRAVRIINLHLTHLRGPAGDDLRHRQAEAMMEAVAKWERSGPQPNAVLLAGDFNATIDAPELAALGGYRGFNPGPVRAFDLPGTLIGEFAAAEGYPFGRSAIDHVVLIDPAGIFVFRSRTRALDAGFGDMGLHPSDHAAVVIDIEQAAGTANLQARAT